MIEIKNVILYDLWQHVSGFVELRTDTGSVQGKTSVKARHNVNEENLILSVTGISDGNKDSHVFNLTDSSQSFEIAKVLDLAREVVICIMQKDGNTVTTVASGAINLASGSEIEAPELTPEIKLKSTSPLSAVLDETEFLPISRKTAEGQVSKYKTEAAKEVDELLRAVCMVDDEGKGICESCPYREYFFGENISEESKDLMIK